MMFSFKCISRYLLKNAYVCEADLLLSNSNLIKKYQHSSSFLGVPVERTDDWCFVTKNGVIQTQQVGGEIESDKKNSNYGLYQEVGISYWSEMDGARLADDIKQVYEMPDGKERIGVR